MTESVAHRSEEATSEETKKDRSLWQWYHNVGLVVLVGLVCLVNWWVTQLPSLGASGLSLLAISTTIYLTGKAVPKRTDDGIAGLSPTPRGSPANVPAASGKGGEV
jgi:hypothetical protein